ncbi:cohesin domain-containing protein [Catenibacterium mitsuokai]|uniref:cohesin domain-containing protein n=1 Tax=Catenibacterium mitsuokai TaxID=100886 RepID=UPI0022E3F934|nr:cohesin domain-containing protein [Catenibacterium mitsuokai]
MKRVFKLLVVAITVFASLSLNNVYAANENLVIERNTLKDGHIEVLVDVKEDAHIYGGELIFEYNKDQLELESVKSNKEQNMLVSVNKNYKNEGNKIKAVFASAEEVVGHVFAITLKSKDNEVKDEDIVIDQVSVGDKDGKIIPEITQSTVTVENEAGESKVTASFEDVDKTQKTQEKTYDTQKAKTSATQESKKEVKESKKSNNMIYIAGAVVILVIGLIAFKMKKK